MELSYFQLDVLQELVNIGMGRAAGALNQMTRAHIELSAPSIRLMRMTALKRHGRLTCQAEMDIVTLRFRGTFSGLAALFFQSESGTNLVELILGERQIPAGMDGLRCDTLREVGNIVLIWVMGAMANTMEGHLDYAPLRYTRNFEDMLKDEDAAQTMALLIKADFSVERHVVQGNVLALLDARGYAQLLAAMDNMVREKY